MTATEPPLFAERLKALRSRAGLTQKQLADRAGVPLPSVANYEAGRREPGFAVGLRLAEALSVPAEAFTHKFAEVESVTA